MATQTPERDRKSLKDLARLASSPSLAPAPPSTSRSVSGIASVRRAGEAAGEDSGLIDLKALAASDPNMADRASVTPLASTGLFDDDGAAPTAPIALVPLQAAGASHAAPAMPSLSATLAASRGGSGAREAPGRGRTIALGLLGAAAVAAGLFFVVQRPAGPQPIVMVPPTTAQPEAPPAAVKANVAPAAPTTPAEHAVAPAVANALVPAPAATVASAPEPKAAAHPKAVAAKPVAKAAEPVAAASEPAAPKPEPKPDPKLVAKDLPTAPAAHDALSDAMKQAAGPSGQGGESAAAAGAGAGAAPAAFAPGSVPQKPSQGAVTGALGAALPSARACLGPDDAVSRAQVVFGSEGGVHAVNVTGGASGTPAEACIKAALGKARVPAFAQASYSATVTVRPN